MAKRTKKEEVVSIQRVCFCCDKKLGVAMPHGNGIDYPPDDATFWRSPGNYGSTVFDPMDDTFLEAYICDPCLVKGKSKLYRARVAIGRETVIVTTKTDIFE